MSKPRIIGGSAKGRTLETPKRGTRPSPSRLREALFNILAFGDKGSFLDLYSGSGAVGLEAASRGWRATCVDLSSEAAQVIRKNARSLKLEAEGHPRRTRSVLRRGTRKGTISSSPRPLIRWI